MVIVFMAGFRNFGIRYQRVSQLLANLLTLSGQFSLIISEAFVKPLKPCKLFVCDMEKRSSYSAGFKLRGIDYAEKHGSRAAGREFSVTLLCDIVINRNCITKPQ
jgi:hypothetical protein